MSLQLSWHKDGFGCSSSNNLFQQCCDVKNMNELISNSCNTTATSGSIWYFSFKLVDLFCTRSAGIAPQSRPLNWSRNMVHESYCKILPLWSDCSQSRFHWAVQFITAQWSVLLAVLCSFICSVPCFLTFLLENRNQWLTKVKARIICHIVVRYQLVSIFEKSWKVRLQTCNT